MAPGQCKEQKSATALLNSDVAGYANDKPELESIMPKIKTNRGAAKRFKITAGGVKRRQSHLRHILTKKSS